LKLPLDNKTALWPEVRTAFSKTGGSMVELLGSVAQFSHKGVIPA